MLILTGSSRQSDEMKRGGKVVEEVVRLKVGEDVVQFKVVKEEVVRAKVVK